MVISPESLLLGGRVFRLRPMGLYLEEDFNRVIYSQLRGHTLAGHSTERNGSLGAPEAARLFDIDL